MLFLIAGIGNVWATDYQLVTSTDDLVANAHYVMGATYNNKTYFASTVSNNNNRKLVEATVTDGVVTASETMMSFTLGGSSTGWTFATDNYGGTAGYLNATSTTGSNNLKVVATLDKYAYFTIEIASSGDASITCTGKSDKNIMYLNGSTCISCYSTQTAAQYKKLRLYKEVSAEPALSSISIATAPDKVTYTEGETFDPTGLVINANYDNSTSTGVVYNNSTAEQFTFEPSLTTQLTTENNKVTITWGEQSVDQAITVNPAGGCTNTVSVTKVTPVNGDFTLSATEVCGDGEGGTVFITGITPDEGYELDDITATVGTVDKENSKVTGITDDTEITVTFKELPKYTVSFSVGTGVAVEAITQSAYNADITLPAGTPSAACVDEGWTFAGWATAAVGTETTTAPTLLSGTYKPASDITLYAVYKRTEGGGGAAVGTTMWSENWSGASDKDRVPTSPTSTATVYGSATVAYAWTNGGSDTKLYDDTSGPHTDANNWNVLVGKNSGNITISGIPTGKASTLTLAYAVAGSGTIEVSTTTENVSISGSTITIADAEVTAFNLVFTNTHTSKNSRLDDISVVVATTTAAGTTYYLSAPTCTAKYTLSFAEPTGGTLVLKKGTDELTSGAKLEEGDEVSVTATPDATHKGGTITFKDGEENTINPDDLYFDGTAFLMPAYDITVSAAFEAKAVSAVTISNPAHCTITVLDGENAIGETVMEGKELSVSIVSNSEAYKAGTITAHLTNTPETAVTITNGKLTMPAEAITITATETELLQVAVAVAVEGKDGDQGNTASINGGAGPVYVEELDDVTLVATPAAGYEFVNWTTSSADIDLGEDATKADGAKATIGAAGTITANFKASATPSVLGAPAELNFGTVRQHSSIDAAEFTLTGANLEHGLTLTAPDGFTVDPTEIAAADLMAEGGVKVTVTPSTDYAGDFTNNLTIAGDDITTIEVPLYFEVTETFLVQVAVSGNGSATVNGAASVYAAEDDELTLEATPAEGHQFVNWEINEDNIVIASETSANTTASTIVGAVTITANFEVIPQRTIQWFINGVKKGEQTATVGTELTNIPDATLAANGAIFGKVFKGWAEAEIEGEVAENAAGIVATPTEMPNADKTYYAVYAEETPGEATEHALGSATTGGSNGNTASDGYTFSRSEKYSDKAGYVQDSGTKDETIIFMQVKSTNDTQIIPSQPSAITVKATLGGGSAKDPLGYNVYAVLIDKDGANVGDPVVVTTKILSKEGDEFTADMPVANYANVRGFKVYHMKEDNYNVRYYAMSLSYTTSAASTYSKFATSGPKKLAAPQISLAEGTYDEAKNITLTADEGDIYYTLDGEDPTTESTKYTAAIELNVYGDYTLKAFAAKDDGSRSEVVSANYSMKVPFATVAGLIQYVEDNTITSLTNVTVTGIISQIDGISSNAITYWISDDGQTNAFEVYKGKGINGANFEAVTDLTVGDLVKVNGNYILYEPEQGDPVHEFASYSSKLVERTTAEVASVAISGEASTTSYVAGDAFSFAGLTATATYNTGYVKDVTNEANVWTADPATMASNTTSVSVTASFGGKTSDAKVVAVTVTTYTIVWTRKGTTDVEELGTLARMGETDQFALTMEKEPAAATYTVSLLADGVATGYSKELVIEEHAKYQLYFEYNPDAEQEADKFTASAAYLDVATEIDNTLDGQKAVKVIKDNKVYIIRGDKTYNVTGQVVK